MGIFDSLKDTGQLLKNTFVIIGKNPAIFRPTIAQIWIGSICYLFLVISLLVTFFTSGVIQMIFVYIALFFIMLLIPVFPFIKMYYRAAQCWIVYHTFTGKNITYQDGLARAKQNKGDIFILGLFDIILTALSKKLKQGTGRGGIWQILNVIMWILGKAVEEGWDLINHFLLPAAIIQEKNVGEVLPEIKNIKNNVPGALAGVFGLDFAGDMIRRYVNWFMAIFIFLGFLTYIFLKTSIPLVIIVIISIGINLLIKVFVEMIKTVYFTLFYIALTMPMKISPQYREEVTHYLLHKSSPQNVQPQQSSEKSVDQLVPYIQQYRSQGYRDTQISPFLIQHGWSEKVVKEAIKLAK